MSVLINDCIQCDYYYYIGFCFFVMLWRELGGPFFVRAFLDSPVSMQLFLTVRQIVE
jgi:hypothetical protein